VVVEDSIVRGTTFEPALRLLREAGAAEIHMRIASPPYLNPCYYGADVVSRDNLIACRYSIDELASVFGADSIGYLSIESACRMAGEAKSDTHCMACFTGEYPCAVTERGKRKYALRIGESKQIKF